MFLSMTNGKFDAKTYCHDKTFNNSRQQSRGDFKIAKNRLPTSENNLFYRSKLPKSLYNIIIGNLKARDTLFTETVLYPPSISHGVLYVDVEIAILGIFIASKMSTIVAVAM